MNDQRRDAYVPYFPRRELLSQYLDDVYASGWLTNHGPLVAKLEERLADYLDVPYIVVVSNGTLALQMAIRLLGFTGEVITTPLSFVATANAIQWEGLAPRFADVRSDTFCLDVEQAEQLINGTTSAIMPVHLFGQACDLDGVQKLAERHNLRTIYDAAQAFGLKSSGRNILHYGDISVLSFHATKVFHTVEGGALILRDQVTYERALRFRSHGRVDRGQTPGLGTGLGINAKLSELHAAVGHCLLDEMPSILEHYAQLRAVYTNRLQALPQIRLPVHACEDHRHRHYLPALVTSSALRETIEQRLAQFGITPRRYFDPPLNCLPHFAARDVCPRAEELSQRILLLPMPAQAGLEIVHQVCDSIFSSVNFLSEPYLSLTEKFD